MDGRQRIHLALHQSKLTIPQSDMKSHEIQQSYDDRGRLNTMPRITVYGTLRQTYTINGQANNSAKRNYAVLLSSGSEFRKAPGQIVLVDFLLFLGRDRVIRRLRQPDRNLESVLVRHLLHQSVHICLRSR